MKEHYRPVLARTMNIQPLGNSNEAGERGNWSVVPVCAAFVLMNFGGGIIDGFEWTGASITISLREAPKMKS